MTCITQVSTKITIRKRHVYIDIRWPWKWKQYFYFAIWEDDPSKIIFLPSFQLVTRLNSQNRNETSLLMNSDTLICIWILAFPIGIIQVSTTRNEVFFTLFQFLSRLLTSNHFHLISTLLVGRKGVMWKCAFQLLKMRKMKVRRNIKTKCVTNFSLTGLRVLKDYTCHYVGST